MTEDGTGGEGEYEVRDGGRSGEGERSRLEDGR